MSTEYKLEAKYDSRNSFYGKAKVVEEYNSKSLISYKSCICQIQERSDEVKVVKIYNVRDHYGNSLTFSSTSLRHLKEFLKQEGFKAESRAQIEADYDVYEGNQVDACEYGVKKGEL